MASNECRVRIRGTVITLSETPDDTDLVYTNRAIRTYSLFDPSRFGGQELYNDVPSNQYNEEMFIHDYSRTERQDEHAYNLVVLENLRKWERQIQILRFHTPNARITNDRLIRVNTHVGVAEIYEQSERFLGCFLNVAQLYFPSATVN